MVARLLLMGNIPYMSIYLIMCIITDFLRRSRSRIVDTSAIFQTSEAASPPGGLGGLAPRGARRPPITYHVFPLPITYDPLPVTYSITYYP